MVEGHVGVEDELRLPHFIQIYFSSKTVPVFLASWEVEIPEMFIVVEYKEKVEEASESDQAEEQHEERVEQLDHFPVNALTPAGQQKIRRQRRGKMFSPELVKCY